MNLNLHSSCVYQQFVLLRKGVTWLRRTQRRLVWEIFQGENQLDNATSSSDYHGQFMILTQARAVVGFK